MRISDWSSDVCSSDLPDLVQGSRRIVRAEIATVAPDRAVVHQAVFEEHFLAVADVLASEQDLPRVIDDLRRDRRRIVIGKPGDADQLSEPDEHHDENGTDPPWG